MTIFEIIASLVLLMLVVVLYKLIRILDLDKGGMPETEKRWEHEKPTQRIKNEGFVYLPPLEDDEGKIRIQKTQELRKKNEKTKDTTTD